MEARTQQRGRRSRAGWLRLAAAAAVVTACIVVPDMARAAEQYNVGNFECGGRRGSGQVDAAGNLYVSCYYQGGVYRPHVQVYDANGNRRQTIDLTAYATDVAPSPDGSKLYVVDNQSKTPRRYVRQATGAYVLDAAWKLADYLQWGTAYRPLGEFLATDAPGNVYFSSGTWVDSTSPAIVKYDAEGRFVTWFGYWQNAWDPGIFYWMNAGIAVAPDGSSVYVAEVGNNRVQRFDRQADGGYVYAWKIGNDPAIDDDPRTGLCGEGVREGRLAAPYDVGLDAAGNVYVLNTTCVQVKKFAPNGTLLHTEQLANANGGYVHGMAVDRAGRVYLAEIGKVMRPGNAPVVPVEPQYQWITDQYRGWAYITARAPATTVGIWKWTANGWVHTTVPSRTRMWAQPFAAGWMWVWKDNVWYAARTRDVAL